VIGHAPANTAVDRAFPNGLYDAAKAETVCFIVKPVGEPDAGNPHVRFDERGWETGRHLRCHRAHPRLYRTESKAQDQAVRLCLAAAAKHHSQVPSTDSVSEGR
jgi:hypothetical protein